MKISMALTPFFVSVVLSFQCKKEKGVVPASVDSIPIIKTVTPGINEVSGIANSKLNTGYMWAHEDSGNPPQLYLIDYDGKLLKKIFIKGATNRDWEDMVLSGSDIYIGDIGDNNKVHTEYVIYQFAEPASATDTIKNYVAIKFKYADGAHDAEAFLVDHLTKDVYIITKNDNPSKIYKLSYPYNTSGTNIASPVGSLSYGGVVSAALSTDRKEIIVKTYTGLNSYPIKNGEAVEAALEKNFMVLFYQLEPQGEAVTFGSNNKDYFTLSEKGFGSSVSLYLYQRK